MANNLGLWNETFGFGREEFQISNIEDHAVPIFKLQYWQLVLLICYYSICASIAIVGEALVIFYILQHAPKERPLNRMILIDQVCISVCLASKFLQCGGSPKNHD